MPTNFCIWCLARRSFKILEYVGSSILSESYLLITNIYIVDFAAACDIGTFVFWHQLTPDNKEQN